MKRIHFLILLLALAAGVFLRFHDLAVKTLWIDEINGIRTALTPWPDFWAVVKAGEHPPLFFLIHRFFLVFGENEFFARLPAAIFGILSILCMFVLGKNTLGRPAGALAALLWSFSVIDISQSQNARNYTILVFLSILSLNLLVQAFYRKRRGSYWAWIVVNILLPYTHYFGLFVVSGEALFLFFHLLRDRPGFPRREAFGWVILGVIIPALGFLPWAYLVFLPQAREAIGYFPYFLEPTGHSLLVLANYFVYGIWDTFTVRYPRSPLIVLGILLLAGMAGKRKPEETARGLLVFFPLITLLTVFSLAALNIKVITPRNLLIILPPLCLLAARGLLVLGGALLGALAGNRGREYDFASALALAVILLGRLGSATLAQYYNDGYHMENDRGSWKQAVEFLRDNLRPEDRVLAYQLPGTSRFCLDYYLEKEKLAGRIEFADDFEALEDYVGRGIPVYLLFPHRDEAPEDPGLIKIFQNHLTASRHFHLLDIYYLDLPSRANPVPPAVTQIGKDLRPVRMAAGDFLYPSGWFTMNVIQGRYTVNLFHGEFLIYRFFCRVPASYSISADFRKEELWRKAARVEMTLDHIPFASVPIRKSGRWVTGGNKNIYLSRGHHNLILHASGESESSRGLALSLSGITIAP